MDPVENKRRAATQGASKPSDLRRPGLNTTVRAETAPAVEQLAPAKLQTLPIQTHDAGRLLGEAYDDIRSAFRIASERGTAHWPQQWRQALQVFESYRMCPATAENGTQTPNGSVSLEFPEALRYARTASLMEIAKNNGADTMYSRGFVHGFTNRTVVMPKSYTRVPQSPRWERILRLIENDFKKPTSAKNSSKRRSSDKQFNGRQQESKKSRSPMKFRPSRGAKLSNVKHTTVLSTTEGGPSHSRDQFQSSTQQKQ